MSLTRLAAMRLAMGVPQKKMARDCGMGRTSYNQIERGRLKPSMELAERIEGVFGKPIHTLLESVTLKDLERGA